jgi:hypothetical protein
MRRFGCGHIGGGHEDHELSQRAHKSRKQEDRPSQGIMWTVDPTPYRSFEDRELEMSKNIDIKNPEIAMCEILTEPEPSDQDVI